MKLFTTHIYDAALKNVQDVLKTGMLSEGEWVERFESELKRKLHFNYLATVNSGTSALFLALKLAGIKPGDEVILAPQTFVASALEILHVGAKPVFVDIDRETGNLSCHYLEGKITAKTKVIMPVHWGGLPCDLERINKIADGYGLKVIEDAAHALGASYKGIPIGNYSDFTCFSFQAIKTLTTGDGGAVTFRNPIHERMAKKLRWFNIDREQDKANGLGERQYTLVAPGYKLHMNNVAAAIGLGQLIHWQEIMDGRAKVRAKYIELLSGVDGIIRIIGQDVEYEYKHGNWLFTILVDRRNDFIRKMKAEGIEVSVVHQGITKHPLFRAGGDLGNQRYWDDHQINLPIHEMMLNQDVVKVCDAIKSGW